MKHQLSVPLVVALTAAAMLALPAFAAGRVTIPNPDFTKGEPIPESATHDWNLGATGARGWMYCDQLGTTDAGGWSRSCSELCALPGAWYRLHVSQSFMIHS